MLVFVCVCFRHLGVLGLGSSLGWFSNEATSDWLVAPSDSPVLGLGPPFFFRFQNVFYGPERN